jgi:hypothetical protein
VPRARERVLGAASLLASAQTEPGDPPVRADIATSWRRCQLVGVAANGEDVPYNPEFDWPSRLLRAAAPLIGRLAEPLTDSPGTIILADSEAPRSVQPPGPTSRTREAAGRTLVPRRPARETTPWTCGCGSAGPRVRGSLFTWAMYGNATRIEYYVR